MDRETELLLEREALKAELKEARSKANHWEEAFRLAEAASQSKSEFLTHMSQELRNPLQSISGQTEFLFDANLSVPERLGAISKIRGNVVMLTELVDGLLDLSRVESDETASCSSELSLVDELQETFSALHSQAMKKRIRLAFSSLGKIPERLTTDRRVLKKGLLHLLSHSIQSTIKGSVTVKMRHEGPEAGHPHNVIFFRVEDTSGGMSQADQGMLFSSSGRSLTPSAAASVGLVIARQLARSVGGDLVLVESVPGKGNTFELSLPIGMLGQTRWLDPITEQALLKRETLTTQTTRQLEGMSVLVVEDAKDVQHLIRRFLTKFGANVDLADNGVDGINKAKAKPYDVVLMDIQMPVLDGIQATAQLHEEGYQRPIIALTAQAMNGVREKCLRAGFTDFLTKPINASAMVSLIEQHRKRA